MTRKVVVGVGGGIAAFKTAGLVSKLVQSGHAVDTVLTNSATQFIGPATFTALCGRAAVTDTHDQRFPLGPHIELADGTDLLIVAPATARLIASFALGLADDLLATLYLACRCPVLVAPAMNSAMWDAPSVQRNIETLQSDGVHFVGPDSGWLSCRQHGSGRMSDPEAIRDAAEKLLK
ncbi:MAG: phosphopantothenoylcysteine decarboxylase [Aureliella sp.]